MPALPEIPAMSCSLSAKGGKECRGSPSHFQLLVGKDKQIEDGESKANFLLSPARISEKGCEVPVYEFRFC